MMMSMLMRFTRCLVWVVLLPIGIFLRPPRETLVMVILLMIGSLILIQYMTYSESWREKVTFNMSNKHWDLRDDPRNRKETNSSNQNYVFTRNNTVPILILNKLHHSAFNKSSVIGSSNISISINNSNVSRDLNLIVTSSPIVPLEISSMPKSSHNKTNPLTRGTSSVITNVYPGPRSRRKYSNRVRTILSNASTKENTFVKPYKRKWNRWRRHRVLPNKTDHAQMNVYDNVKHINALRNNAEQQNEDLVKITENGESFISADDEVLLFKKSLTALLNEVTLPTPLPAYDIVSPGASAEETNEPSPGKPLCPAMPPNLDGPIYVSYNMPTISFMEHKFADLNEGRWQPQNCTARHRVAIIIPYRDREEHLRVFLNHMHPFLQKQLLDYGIYIIEQDDSSRFNRAMLMNIGFVEAGKLYDNQCYMFHDVDLLPEDDRNLYSCPKQPRHMSAAVDTLSYKLPYATIFGGVAAFKTEHFRNVNGFSNCFFGWGGEDDDLYNRIKHHGYRLKRYPLRIARYRMIQHLKEYPSPNRFTYLNSGSDRFDKDGLNNLKYDVIKVTKHKLFTKISVKINEDDVMKEFVITEMPFALADVDFYSDNKEISPDVGEQNTVKPTKKQQFYTLIKQSDIQKIIAKLKNKTLSDRERAQLKRNVTRLFIPDD